MKEIFKSESEELKVALFRNVSLEQMNQLLNDENASLITTIESQKEELDRLQEREFNHYPIEIEELESRIFKQQDQIDSLKAITELAVKGLKWYADKKNWNLGVSISMGSAFPLHEAIKSDKGKIATTALSEIERLTNGTT